MIRRFSQIFHTSRNMRPNLNINISVSFLQMHNCNISKSKLAFPLSNKIYLSVIASTALKLLRLKQEYFFLGHPVYWMMFSKQCPHQASRKLLDHGGGTCIEVDYVIKPHSIYMNILRYFLSLTTVLLS